MNKLIKGFTLAEVLITLTIIGVVAALTLPALQSKINDKVFEAQRKTAAAKLTEAVSMINVNDGLAASSSTEDFISKLKEQYKITKVCEKDDLSSCFTNFQSQKTLNILSVVMPPAYAMVVEHNTALANLNLYLINTGQKVELMGMRLADGTSMLIGYVPDCNTTTNSTPVYDLLSYRYDLLPYTASLNQVNANDFLVAADDASGLSAGYPIARREIDYGSTTILPVAKDLRACVGAVIDVNGDKRPNTLSQDVFLYQAYNLEFVNGSGDIRDTDLADEMSNY